MRITPELTDTTTLRILGERIEQYRIAAELTQAELAERAGIGKRTLERVEAGGGAELITLIRVLRALDLLEGFEKLLPELPPSPLEQLKLRGKQRRRVSRPRGHQETRHSNEVRESAPTKPWTWRAPPVDVPSPATGSHPKKRRT